MSNYTVFSDLVGKTITSIVGGQGDEQLTIETGDDKIYRMYHNQDCCEHVYLEDIAGDLSDLVGSPILTAEESSSEVLPEGLDREPYHYRESEEWTFYRISTAKGLVVIRWYGASDYYSTRVDFVEM